MILNQGIVFILTLLLMMLGLLGTVVPGVPGAPLIFVAALGNRLLCGEDGPAWWVVIVLGVIAGISVLLDFAGTAVGARSMGATWKGTVGATIGAMIGVLWLPFGLLIGPLIGAVLMEMLAGREWREAGKAGLGALLGILLGTVGRIVCAIAMIGLFVVNTVLHWIALATKG